MLMTINGVWSKSEINRASYLRLWLIASLVVPIVLDFIFFGSRAARYSRVILFCVVSVSLLVNSKYFLTGKFVGVDTIFFTILLFLVGTIAGFIHGGVITPNFATLLLFMIIAGLNFDLYEEVLKAIAFSCHLLISLSILVIILKINPRDFYFSAVGYPVYFNFLGIPGRNYGVFSHPNVLGQVATLSALFLLAFRNNRVLLFAPLLCILKCGSRTSIICLVTGVVLFVIISMKKSKYGSKIRKVESPLVIGAVKKEK